MDIDWDWGFMKHMPGVSLLCFAVVCLYLGQNGFGVLALFAAAIYVLLVTTATRRWLAEASSEAGQQMWGNFLRHPAPWATAAMVFVTAGLFWFGAGSDDTRWLHLAVVASVAVVVFFITCFDGWWAKIGNSVTRHPAGTWVTASLIALVVTGGHALMLGEDVWKIATLVSLLSLMLAAIVAAGYGEWLWNKTGGAAIECLTWGRGPGAFLLAWAATAGAIAIYLVGKDLIDPAMLEASYGLFILLGFVGLGVVMILPVHKAKKGL